ncbi:MAG: hypothetical protein A3G08_02710 [Candidatus Magasanikbacteria bacterium RIFCSPLOWO2_12_FULL_47_9b]|nr:MAG: hypothetical protein A3C10_02995 [Candidatus Magasanikbacteria bacterium RIFCSPHIGHO2_02_FULL_48_18]OGH83197.1 MAG: hypothetical protein A3G08_02710 [Candidatus Magasanikbacteria bacterium RIFCSPLOWO2_12_FULL_47_9b]
MLYGLGGILLLLLIIVGVFKVLFYYGTSMGTSYPYNQYYEGDESESQTGALGGVTQRLSLDRLGDQKADLEAATPGPKEPGQPDDGSVNRLIIKTGSLSMVVEDVAQTIADISAFAGQEKGFVVASQISQADIAPSGSITIRIPSARFDAAVAAVSNMGEVENRSVNGQDVTEEYVDLDAQLGNLRAAESQFLEIMKKAIRIDDILAVQRELTTVRAHIEQIEGRMKYLKQSADLSTLTVYLSTDPEGLPAIDDSDSWKPIAVVKEAMRSLTDLGKGLVSAIIWVVIYIPLWLLLFLVVYLVRRVIRRKRMQKNGRQ